jgi:hypothetical protein
MKYFGAALSAVSLELRKSTDILKSHLPILALLLYRKSMYLPPGMTG